MKTTKQQAAESQGEQPQMQLHGTKIVNVPGENANVSRETRETQHQGQNTETNKTQEKNEKNQQETTEENQNKNKTEKESQKRRYSEGYRINQLKELAKSLYAEKLITQEEIEELSEIIKKMKERWIGLDLL